MLLRLARFFSSMLSQFLKKLVALQEELSEEHERRQLLWQAIESLPEPHRIPLLLREIEGLSYREIAQALDLEEGTVKSRLARARLLLRKLLLQKGNLPTGSPSNQLGRKDLLIKVK